MSLWRGKKEEESSRRVQSLQTEVEKISIIEKHMKEKCTGVQRKAKGFNILTIKVLFKTKEKPTVVHS